MKNFFDIKVTNENEIFSDIDGASYKIAEADEEQKLLLEKQEKITQSIVNSIFKTGDTVALGAVISWIVTIISALRIIPLILSVPINTKSVIVCAFVSAVFLYCSLILTSVYKKKKRKNSEDMSEQAIIELENKLQKGAIRIFDIPEGVNQTEVMYIYYVYEDGKKKSKYEDISDFALAPFYIFKENGGISVCDYRLKYHIPEGFDISCERISEKTTLDCWFKGEPMTAERYMKYGLSENEEGSVIIPYYHKVTFTSGNDQFYFLIPCYEEKLLENL